MEENVDTLVLVAAGDVFNAGVDVAAADPVMCGQLNHQKIIQFFESQILQIIATKPKELILPFATSSSTQKIV